MIVRMAARGLLTIPSAIRRKLGMAEHTLVRVDMDERNSRIVLTPITSDHVYALRGKFKSRGLLKALATERARNKDR
jgi:bifunctional DNA-binding transcriptional regulator/antitoxin component of YhaV-PrlF toxin-antitoxin module